MNHNIIDNRNEKLVDYINLILDSSDAARFAAGYFFLSGLTAILERLAKIKELRLLIGNTTNRETLEQLAEGYHRLEMVAEAAEAGKLRYPREFRIEMFRAIADGIRRCDKKVQIALCKETPQVWKAVGLDGKGLFCNCTG